LTTKSTSTLVGDGIARSGETGVGEWSSERDKDENYLCGLKIRDMDSVTPSMIGEGDCEGVIEM